MNNSRHVIILEIVSKLCCFMSLKYFQTICNEASQGRDCMFSGQCYFQTLICCENHYCQVLDAQLCNMSVDSLE